MNKMILKGALVCTLAMGVAVVNAAEVQTDVLVPATIDVREAATTTVVNGIDFGIITLKKSGTTVVTMTEAAAINIDVMANAVHTGVSIPGVIEVNGPTGIKVRPFYTTSNIAMARQGGGGTDLQLLPRVYGGTTLATGGNTYDLTGTEPLHLDVVGSVTISSTAIAGIYTCNVPVSLFWE